MIQNQIFNVRVYGLLVHENRLLVSDEIHHGRSITKFPGGGLQFGEGTLECLRREFMEELEIEISVQGHFYTTDFYQQSAFDINHQVISIYYLVDSPMTDKIETASLPFEFGVNNNANQRFRWIPLDQLIADAVTFPIDKKVVELLQEKFRV